MLLLKTSHKIQIKKTYGTCQILKQETRVVGRQKLQELISECEAFQFRLNKSVKNKKESDQKAFSTLILKGQIKQALKFVNTADDINGTHVINADFKHKLNEKHTKAH